MSSPLQVLIIEDSEDDALLLMQELMRGGYDPRFLRVETPEAAADAFDGPAYDLILCDYMMPRWNAQGVLKLYKQRNVKTPLIVVSGAIGEYMAAQMIAAGAYDYVPKGSPERLLSAMKRLFPDQPGGELSRTPHVGRRRFRDRVR